jgi:glycosyltransferase involved in cell wall biosynthesis
MRILHAIHDFLPRHQEGSEIYAFDLCRELSGRHHVTVVCAEFDPSRRHGHVQWRVHKGLPVIELVNNYVCESFEETYRAQLLSTRIADVLRAVQPDVIHVHSLMNLSFDLPALAHAQGIPVVTTLHDYALVCPSGGQRIHRADRHLCDIIDTDRCTRCFIESPISAHIAYGRLAAITRAPGRVHRAADTVRRRFPRLANRLLGTARRAASLTPTKADVDARMAAARRLFEEIDLFVAPSPSIAAEFERLGIDPHKIRISDYGFVDIGRADIGTGTAGRPYTATEDDATRRPLKVGYVGTLVWHKGAHVLLEAVRALDAGAYELKIFGNPDVFPDYMAELRALAAGLPVHFMGRFDRERIAEVYRQIDVLVVPSLWLENSPLVIHEAFMAGVPIVGARIGGIAGLVEDGGTGLLYDPASAVELAAALRRLIENPAYLAALAARVRSVPRVKSIAEDAREWEEAYADVRRRRTAASVT